MTRDRVDTELSVRALVAGGIVGAVLALSNVYLGLKVGLFDGGAITAAIVGFTALAAAGGAPSPRETNAMVTCAAAAAMMAGSTGLVGPVAAMALLGHGVAPGVVVAWALALGVLGVLIALPLRAPMTGDGGLPFPTGQATAEVIASMGGARGRGRARALAGGFAASAAVAWFRDGRPAVIPASVPLPGSASGHSLESLGVGVGVSPLLLSVGALIGARNGASLLAGGAIAWLVLAPALIDHGVIASAAFPDVIGWLLWPGAGLVVASTLTSLALGWRVLARGARELRALFGRTSLVVAIAVTGAAAFAIGWLGAGVHPAAAAIGVALAPVLAAACARATGETDLGPVGPLGGVGQIVAAPATPGNPIATLGAGAIVNGAAAQTMQLMYAFRAGAVLGSTPRVLVAAQLVGVAIGAAVVVPLYELFTRAYGLGSVALPAGAPLSWKATAEAVSGGVGAMPPYAPLAAAIGAGLGVALTLLERTRARRLLPAPVALGMAFFLPASYAVTIFLGALAFWAVRRRWPAAAEQHGAAIAAGGIAGEAVLGTVIALLAVLGAFGAS
jgi:uncharacterized oligopeptide transporter (OPT) family protein